MDRLKKVRCFLLDMDGTVYLGNKPFRSALEFFEVISKQGVMHMYVTNNSSRSPAEYERKLSAMGLPAPPGSVYTSGDATLEYLKSRRIGPKIYLLGTKSLFKMFEEEGFVITDNDPAAVVLGFDMDLTYHRVETACRLINRGTPFIATHPDLVCPVEGGSIPDAGAIAEMISAATSGTKPTVIGKPQPAILEAALSRAGVPPERAAMVGDRLYTDMVAARRAGMLSVLVLSGETDRSMLDECDEQPDLVFEDIGSLARALSKEGEP